MKTVLIGVAAAAVLALSVPASAQVRIYGGNDDVSVGVRIGPDRPHYRHHYRSYRDHHASCRTVTVRKRMPDGSVVVRKTRRC